MRTRIARLIVIFAVAIQVTSPAGAEERTGSAEKSPTDAWSEFPPSWDAAIRTTGDDALYLLTSPLRLTPETAVIVGGTAAGIGGLSLGDRAIRNEIRHRRKDTLRDTAAAVSLFGDAGVLFGLNVATVAVGEGIREYSGQGRLLNAALVATEAQILTLALSKGIAYSTARSRPEDSNDPFKFKFGRDSFPSAHASQAFAVASVFADRYDGPVPALAFGLAGLVGVARLVEDKHWASDVAAGGVLGWAIGRALSHRHSGPHRYLDFFPFADPETKKYGFLLMKEF